MKVVLFCGGEGIRLREYSEQIPKPMVPIGYRPILWNVMKYYANFGHNDFILCLGYKEDVIKKYFINYDETVSNDFIFKNGGKNIKLFNSDIHDWKITFVDTGLHSNIGMRLLRVRDYLKGEKMFLANYSDGLTDLHLPDMINWFEKKKDKTAGFVVYKPGQSVHVVHREEDGTVHKIIHIKDSGLHLNTGYFVFRDDIFDYIEYGEELVQEPFQRLIEKNRLISWEHKGFWASMDTFKDKKMLDDLYEKGNPVWEVWKKPKRPAQILKAIVNHVTL